MICNVIVGITIEEGIIDMSSFYFSF